MLRATTSRALPAIVLALALTPPAGGQLLGRIEFPNSGAEEAQADFLAGVLYLHNFEYEDAADAFRRARAADPHFALAYWGEAMTHNHPIWMEQNRDAALAALAPLGATLEERLARAPTERERAYLRALETLLGNTPESLGKSKEERDFLYRDEMRRLHQAFPDDLEATSFYALSILGTAHRGRDFRTYMEAAAVAMAVWTVNDDHPGAAHYLIHAFDDPIHAPLGLPMAFKYSSIAPAAAHAQHMTSHIFVALGLWDRVIDANVVARRVQNEGFAARGWEARECGHYPYWLLYGHLQAGRYGDAAADLDRCRATLDDRLEGSKGWHLAVMRARYVLDSGDWSAAERWSAEPGGPGSREYHFVNALAALVEGALEEARAERQRMGMAAGRDDDPGDAEVSAVLAGELDALILRATGEHEGAIELLREAAEAEAAMPYQFGPPAVAKPARELLAEVLLDLDRPAEAAAAFAQQLERTPRRTVSLLGLARAAGRSGDAARAADAWAELAAIWHAADDGVAGLREARAAAAKTSSP